MTATKYIQADIEVLEVNSYDFTDEKSGRAIKGTSALVRLCDRDTKVAVADNVVLVEGDTYSASFSVKSSKFPGLVKLTIEQVEEES